MSEVTPTPEELVEEIMDEIDDSSVIPMPIDTTLTHEGEAADAYYTGQAIGEVLTGLQVNGRSPDGSKHITVYGGDIKMSSDEGAQTVAQAIEDAGDRTASDITYTVEDETIITVKDAIDGIKSDLETDLTDEDVAEIMEAAFGEDDE